LSASENSDKSISSLELIFARSKFQYSIFNFSAVSIEHLAQIAMSFVTFSAQTGIHQEYNKTHSSYTVIQVEDDQISIFTTPISFCFFVKTAVALAIVDGTVLIISTQTWLIDFVVF
jgi:hypothetical protein